MLRIGIAIGEVVIADDTITGEGVVLAQRLEQLAGPGNVCIQGAAHETVPKRFPFAYEDLGECQLKGFDTAIRAYRVRLASGADVPQPDRTPGLVEPAPPVDDASTMRLDLPDRPSIAVLPLVNMSGDPEQEFFSDGVAEDIITELSRFATLLVVARNSSFRYRGDDIDIKRVGRELGVHYVLEGSIRKGGDRVRINVQAHRHTDRESRLGESLRPHSGRRVRGAGRDCRSRRGQRSRAGQRRRDGASEEQTDQLALRLRLLPARFVHHGAHYSYAGDLLDTTVRAKDYFEQALALDPDFAEALAQLAMAHVFLSYFGPTSPGSMVEAEAHSERAVVIDQGNAIAHSVLGMCLHDAGNHERAARTSSSLR